MNDSGQVGSCTNCTAFTYAQSLCDPCSRKAAKEDAPKIYCATCEDDIVDIEGQNCEGCIEEHKAAHEDGSHMFNCIPCEELKLKGDYDET